MKKTTEEVQKEIDTILALTKHWNGGIGLIIPEWLYKKAKLLGIKLPEEQFEKRLEANK